MELDADRCYLAVQAKDVRFDGQFITAVRTTGIYCRPSCPAITPKRHNVEFFRTAAAAHDHGYRACKRCRPDAAPGSPEWDRRGDLVARAMRLIGDGAVEREGVAGLARRLHYSERQLNRLVTTELGSGPLRIARAQRAQTARTLIESSDLSFTTISSAAGFGSLRQFNDTLREVFDRTPTELRARRRVGTAESNGGVAETNGGAPGAHGGDAGSIVVDLAVRQPFDLGAVLGFLRSRLLPRVETFVDGSYQRAVRLPHGAGVVAVGEHLVELGDRRAVRAHIRLEDWRDLGPAVRRLRSLLDLDTDPVDVDSALATDPLLAPLVAARPGLRVPGSVDPFETLVRAIVGQQVSVAGARTVVGRVVEQVGTPLPPVFAGAAVDRLFPTAADVAELDPAHLAMPTRRRATILEAARRVALGKFELDAGVDRREVRAELLDVPGIGPWTADYVLLRGLGDPDAFLPTDLGVLRGADHLGVPRAEIANRAAAWSPWRSYALHHLWELSA